MDNEEKEVSFINIRRKESFGKEATLIKCVASFCATSNSGGQNCMRSCAKFQILAFFKTLTFTFLIG